MVTAAFIFIGFMVASQRRRRLAERLKRPTPLHRGDDTKVSTVLTQRRQTFCSPRRHTVGAVNETNTNHTHTPVHSIGRPRLELRAARRRSLEELALRIQRLTAELAEARAELTALARTGRLEGASIRAIAEAVGLSRPRVYELLNDATESLQVVESMEVGRTCG